VPGVLLPLFPPKQYSLASPDPLKISSTFIPDFSDYKYSCRQTGDGRQGSRRKYHVADKRRSARYRKRLKLRFGAEHPLQLAFTDELSLTGMSIRTQNVLSPGSMVVIELHLPDTTAILLKGRVMWGKRVPASLVQQAKKAGMGIRILEILSGGEKFYQLCSDQTLCSFNYPQEADFIA
jgi:hypothetical protein